MVVEEQLDVDVRSLETCPYSAATFVEILSKIQHAVDDLSLRQYSNLSVWVQRLDEEVEKKLAMRLQAGIQAWTESLTGNKKEVDLSMDTDAPAQPTHKLGGEPQIQNAIHEIRITNQQMYLYPSIEEARFQIMQQLFAWQAIVTSQVRLQSSRYQVGLDKPVSQTYRNLLTKLPDCKILEMAYDAIESKISEVRSYVDEWLRYQSLWDLQADTLYGRLGEDVNLWIKCLNDIKKSRTTFDTSDTRRAYGPIIIDYAKVQAKVTLKYDSWHKEALGKFGTLLGNEMSTFHTKVSKSRTDLEMQSIGECLVVVVFFSNQIISMWGDFFCISILQRLLVPRMLLASLLMSNLLRRKCLFGTNKLRSSVKPNVSWSANASNSPIIGCMSTISRVNGRPSMRS